jgi:hypothetical protein
MKDEFKRGDQVYWVTFTIQGKIAREHGDIKEGLPTPLEIFYRVHEGLVVEARPDNNGVDVYGSKLHHLQNAQVYSEHTEADQAAREQLSSINITITPAPNDSDGPRDPGQDRQPDGRNCGADIRC